MSSLHLPKTLATITQMGTVGVTTPVTPEVLAVLRDELPASAVPMETYLERGGWPELVGIDVRGIRHEGQQIDLLLTLRFIEHTPASCPSSSKPETRIAYAKVMIDRVTAAATWADDS
jgi:hypothetical protein